MEVLAIRFDLHVPEARSLKEKRGVIRPIVEGLRARFTLSVAEVDFQDLWQRCAIGVAVVSADARHATEVGDEVERFVWSRPGIEVTDVTRSWLETDV